MSALRVRKVGSTGEIKRKTQIKTPAKAGVCILAETEGFEPLDGGN